MHQYCMGYTKKLNNMYILGYKNGPLLVFIEISESQFWVAYIKKGLLYGKYFLCTF